MKPYYPMDFVEDMNGKRNPWEAVVLLPFIDIEKLKEAVCEVEMNDSVMASLPDTDKQRNSFGEVFSYHPELSADGDRDLAVPPYTIERAAPDNTPGISFSQNMINGTIIPYHSFPSLRSLPISYIFIRLLHEKAMLGMKYKTLILGISQSTLSSDEQSLRAILGQHVFVNYPMRHEAKVLAVNTSCMEYSLSEGVSDGVIEERLRPEEEQEDWRQHARDFQEHYIVGKRRDVGRGTGGLAIGDVDTILTVLPVTKSLPCGSNGERDRKYADATVVYPIQLVQLLSQQTVRRQRADFSPRGRGGLKERPSATSSFSKRAAPAKVGGTRAFSSHALCSITKQYNFFLRIIK